LIRSSCSGFGFSRRWTHGDELEGSALGPPSVVVHLIGDIVDDAARSDGNAVVLIGELNGVRDLGWANRWRSFTPYVNVTVLP
jgi:hypothetical protein